MLLVNAFRCTQTQWLTDQFGRSTKTNSPFKTVFWPTPALKTLFLRGSLFSRSLFSRSLFSRSLFSRSLVSGLWFRGLCFREEKYEKRSKSKCKHPLLHLFNRDCWIYGRSTIASCYVVTTRESTLTAYLQFTTIYLKIICKVCPSVDDGGGPRPSDGLKTIVRTSFRCLNIFLQEFFLKK